MARTVTTKRFDTLAAVKGSGSTNGKAAGRTDLEAVFGHPMRLMGVSVQGIRRVP